MQGIVHEIRNLFVGSIQGIVHEIRKSLVDYAGNRSCKVQSNESCHEQFILYVMANDDMV